MIRQVQTHINPQRFDNVFFKRCIRKTLNNLPLFFSVINSVYERANENKPSKLETYTKSSSNKLIIYKSSRSEINVCPNVIVYVLAFQGLFLYIFFSWKP